MESFVFNQINISFPLGHFHSCTYCFICLNNTRTSEAKVTRAHATLVCLRGSGARVRTRLLRLWRSRYRQWIPTILTGFANIQCEQLTLVECFIWGDSDEDLTSKVYRITILVKSAQRAWSCFYDFQFKEVVNLCCVLSRFTYFVSEVLYYYLL